MFALAFIWGDLHLFPGAHDVTFSSSSRFPMSPRPDSVHSTTSSSDSHDSEENYVPMNPSLAGEDPVCAGLVPVPA